MNISITRLVAGATALLAVLLGSAACGTETLSETGPGSQVGYPDRVYPPTSVPSAPVGTHGRVSVGKHGRVSSADAAERKAAADKARQDRASTARWDRGTQFEKNQLKQAGHPGRP